LGSSVKGRKTSHKAKHKAKQAETRVEAVARGLLAGLITGTLVSATVLGGVSILIGGSTGRSVGLPDSPRTDMAPEASSVEVTPGSEFELRREDAEAALPTLQEGPVSAETQRIDSPAPDDLAALGGTDTAPALLPETGTAGELAQLPATGDSAVGLAAVSDSPVLPSPQAVAPAIPAQELSPTGIGDAVETDAPETVEVAAPVFPVEEPAPTLMPDTSATVPPDMTDAVAPDMTDAVAPDEGTVAELATDSASAPARTLATAGIIEHRAEGVTTNRLPAITDAPQSTETIAEDPAPETQQGALWRNAASFENPEGKPLMALILIDDGSGGIDPDALMGFPYPVSFAVDVNWDGATAAAERYHSAGFEVLAMIDLPEGASAMDVEVAMQTWLARVPQAVAVLEGTGSGLQSSREASAQLAPILLETGHGLVARPNGLNTAQKLIAREGVPSASLFRDIDAQGQKAAAVRRFLDQAVRKAGQQPEGVIMLGRLRDETISAMLVWGLQDRAANVALAPVSAVLKAASE